MRAIVLTLVALAAAPPSTGADLGAFLGTWRGTSTCVNREFAPACKDEVVVYEVAKTEKPDTVHLKAYKIVNGEKGLMGESDFTFDAKKKCWSSEFENGRVHIVQCLTIQGKAMKGTINDVPTGTKIRAMDLKHD